MYVYLVYILVYIEIFMLFYPHHNHADPALKSHFADEGTE